jgi:hypothetical protein
MIDPNPLQPLSFRPKQPIPNGRAASKKQLDPNCVLDSFQTDTLTTPPEYSTEKSLTDEPAPAARFPMRESARTILK